MPPREQVELPWLVDRDDRARSVGSVDTDFGLGSIACWNGHFYSCHSKLYGVHSWLFLKCVSSTCTYTPRINFHRVWIMARLRKIIHTVTCLWKQSIFNLYFVEKLFPKFEIIFTQVKPMSKYGINFLLILNHIFDSVSIWWYSHDIINGVWYFNGYSELSLFIFLQFFSSFRKGGIEKYSTNSFFWFVEDSC